MKTTKNLMTASEVLINNDLNFNVSAKSLYDSNFNIVKGYKAIVRDDTQECFQVASDKYKIIQNHESLSLLDEIVQSGFAKYSGARSFKNGAVVMIRADVPMNYNIVGDEIKTYIHVLTSHNGSHSTLIIAHSQRVICQNILNGGLKGLECYAKFKHTKNYRLKVSEAQDIFSQYRQAFMLQKEALSFMAQKSFDTLYVDTFLNELLSIEKDKEKQTRKENIKNDIIRLAQYGKGNDREGVRGTRYALFNGVTEYIDHKRGNDTNREYSSLLGSGNTLREKAFAILTR